MIPDHGNQIIVRPLLPKIVRDFGLMVRDGLQRADEM